MDHILSELSTMTRPSWVALHGMAHSFIVWLIVSFMLVHEHLVPQDLSPLWKTWWCSAVSFNSNVDALFFFYELVDILATVNVICRLPGYHLGSSKWHPTDTQWNSSHPNLLKQNLHLNRLSRPWGCKESNMTEWRNNNNQSTYMNIRIWEALIFVISLVYIE